MKITDIKTFNVFTYRTNFVFVKLETDEGISGIGEGTLEYKENALLGAIEDIKRVLIGQDPREVERISHELYRDSYWRVGPVLQSAVSAVNMAMWDIKAKAAGVPVYEMLGGKVRDGVRMYANAWFAGAKTADEFAAAAVKAKNMGVTALKWDPFGKAYMYMENSDFRRSIEIVEAVRGAVGNDVDLLIEGHGRFDIATGIKIANALKPFDHTDARLLGARLRGLRPARHQPLRRHLCRQEDGRPVRSTLCGPRAAQPQRPRCERRDAAYRREHSGLPHSGDKLY